MNSCGPYMNGSSFNQAAPLAFCVFFSWLVCARYLYGKGDRVLLREIPLLTTTQYQILLTPHVQDALTDKQCQETKYPQP